MVSIIPAVSFLETVDEALGLSYAGLQTGLANHEAGEGAAKCEFKFIH